MIVYTAGECELEPPFPEEHPILKHFRKGAGKDVEIANHLQSIRPYVLALRETRRELNRAIKSVLLETSRVILQVEADPEHQSQLLLRSARRRLAATMDSETEVSGEKLLFWEQYIYPALETGLLMGDLLCVVNGDKSDSTSYRLVLTPSCDLVNGKVSDVLVAKCHSKEAYLRAANLPAGGTLNSKQRGKLESFLNEPHCAGYVYLPGFKSVFPSIAACLRDLELVPIEEVASPDNPNARFNRVVSIDSPFREHIAWAYLQVAVRPGMPNRDVERCIQDDFVSS